MGLDMYLTAKYFIGGNQEHRGIRGHLHIIAQDTSYNQNTGKFEPVEGSKPETLLELYDLSMVSYLEYEIAYWRKANQIHQWFVDNALDGNDDCNAHYVAREQLHELVNTCKAVKASLENSGTKTIKVEFGWGPEGAIFTDVVVYTDTDTAEELLPPQSGFFFGTTEIDEWYVKNINETIKQVEAALTNPLFEKCDFYYQASW